MYYLKTLTSFFVSEEKRNKQKHERIEVLKENLIKEGYQPSEVNHFIKMALGSTKVTEMEEKQLELVIKTLEAQIRIAHKCKEMLKDNS